MPYSVKSIFIYPIKSLQGIELEKSELVDYGLKYDRQWMLVNSDNQFLSQREITKLATFKTKIKGDILTVTAPNKDTIQLNLNSHSKANISVTVWEDTVLASKEPEKINSWFSEQLGMSCTLVKLALNQKRLVDNDFAQLQEAVGFADGFPLLIVAQKNIELLNAKLDSAIDMNRFRPNIVIDGLEAHEEDKLHSLIINNIEIKLVKPCSRCVIPAIDQLTGIKRPDILRALMGYREMNKKIYFGMNALHQSHGTIEVSQTVQVIG